MAIIAFVIFAIVFCHFMNKWSLELDELESQLESSNLVVGRFASVTAEGEPGRVA